MDEGQALAQRPFYWTRRKLVRQRSRIWRTPRSGHRRQARQAEPITVALGRRLPACGALRRAPSAAAGPLHGRACACLRKLKTGR